jgi:hypothetical protein
MEPGYVWTASVWARHASPGEVKAAASAWEDCLQQTAL